MEEKRLHTRFRKSYTVSFSLKDSPQRIYDISKLSDISKGGLSFFAVEPYPNGTILLLKVKFTFHAEDVVLEGEVVNVFKLPNNIYKIGVKFVNLSPAATAALDELERSNQEQSPIQENRQHVRFEKKFMAVFFLKNELGQVHTLNWFKDISRGGLKFFSFESYPVGSIIVFNIQFPFLYPQITAIEGEVLECEEILAGKTYRMRVKFVNLSLEATLALENMEK